MKKRLIQASAVVIALAALNEAARWMITRELSERTLSFEDKAAGDVLLASVTEGVTAKNLADAVPFLEVDLFDEEADNWGTVFGSYTSGGALVFDANDDGLLDVYFCRDGRTWIRATDEAGLLNDERRYMSNSLYINQGNDTQGHPTYARLDELASSNDTFVAEELLVENYLRPRQGVSDSKKRYARQSTTAVAADFNNDGRVDLLVGNNPTGAHWSHENTQRVLNRFIDPIGRESRHSKLPITSLINHFVDGYEVTNGIYHTRESSRGVEPEGANSLFLNMGDADADGLPEWRDASKEAGIEGLGTSVGLAVADIDLDGDLDVYVANVNDPDYWPGGATAWAGGVNRLFINQLDETGTLTFVERGAEMGVDTRYNDENRVSYWRLNKIPFLPIEYSLFFMNYGEFQPELLEINGEYAEDAEISWATVFQDVDLDGYPDIWVANDLGMLRLFHNEGGEGFVERDHARHDRTGMWMTMAPADFDGDLKEDLVVGNMGGGLRGHAFVLPDLWTMTEPVITDSEALMTFFFDAHDPTHTIISGVDPELELVHTVEHSTVLPPDASMPNNVRSHGLPDGTIAPFNRNTLDAYEFAWGMTAIDVQNDGLSDLYWIGGLYGRGGGLFPVMGSDPGRLLVNTTETPGAPLQMEDQTAEHHVFNIQEIQYDKLESEGYFYRKAPRQNWKKRDVVYSYDRSVWVSQGPTLTERLVNTDMVQLAENGRAVVAADLNGDGFEDLLVTNMGGYDSRRSDNTNLYTEIDGIAKVVPSPDQNYGTLTNFEPGVTRVFLNQYTDNNWIMVHLLDDAPDTHNRDAIGARVMVNGAHVGVMRSGGGGFLGNRLANLSFGLGAETATSIEVIWPDKDQTRTTLELEGLALGTLSVSKTQGRVGWEPRTTDGSAATLDGADSDLPGDNSEG